MILAMIAAHRKQILRRASNNALEPGAPGLARYNSRMRAALTLLFAAPILASGADLPLDQLLSRISEEAEVFRQNAPKVLAREMLVQRAVRPAKRFHPRLGTAALNPSKPQYRTRQIISEYAFAFLKGAPGALHEFRQVISVDGRQVNSPEKARETLTAGLRSADEAAKRRMLENFEKNGLQGACMDFGQILLLFTRARLRDYKFTDSGGAELGGRPVRILSFEQTGGQGSLLIFDRRKAVHQELQGQIWAKADDGVPVRVILASRCGECSGAVEDRATVDYARTQHGFLAPASVVRRQMSAGILGVEDVYTYSDFRTFAAQSDIEFGGKN